MIIIYSTFASQEEAEKIGKIVLEETLAACVNVFSPVTSLYIWEGAMHEDREYAVFFKTNNTTSEKLMARIKELHSYETPVICALEAAKCDPDYRKWLETQLEKKP